MELFLDQVKKANEMKIDRSQLSLYFIFILFIFPEGVCSLIEVDIDWFLYNYD